MTWTNPATATTTPEQVRMAALRTRLGDTQPATPLITDETIAREFAVQPDLDLLTGALALLLAGAFAQEVSSKTGPLAEEAQQKYEHYMGLAQAYWNLGNGLAPDGSGSGNLNLAAYVKVGSDGLPPQFSRIRQYPNDRYLNGGYFS